MTLQKITPCLWFDDQAEEAARFYTALFPNSKLGAVTRYTEAGQEIHGKKPGSVLTVELELDGQRFTALNGGPMFKFTEAVSLQIHCDTQAELDHFWEKLSAGGDPKAQQCGWLKDKFGVSWQVVPSVLPKLIEDPAKAGRVLGVLMGMQKLDIAALQAAADAK
ncbi:MAG TPA: VOC family protein [Gemmata sp.]|nr:VOC family protein [Gemmata sp.]